MRLRTIDKAEVSGKKVLVRVDFNVAMEHGKVEDDFRIKHALPTLLQLLKKKAKVILIAHLGRPENARTQRERQKLSLEHILSRIEKDMRRTVRFVPDCVGEKARAAADALGAGEVLLLENLRFHPEEEANDKSFARDLASLADLYVNEAFSVSHRAHASVEAITRCLPSYAGLELAREVRVLHQAYLNPELPLVVAMGGAKVETKARLIKRFSDKATHVLLGGIIANAVLEMHGIAIGRSKLDPETAERIKGLDWLSTKIHLPVDVVVAKEMSGSSRSNVVGVGNVSTDKFILDVGPDTIKLFAKIVASAGTIIWNGPLGYSELPAFAEGTMEFAKAVAASKAFKIIGGGESVSAVDKLGLSDSIDFISTGGGAMLEFLSGDALPGIEALRIKN